MKSRIFSGVLHTGFVLTILCRSVQLVLYGRPIKDDNASVSDLIQSVPSLDTTTPTFHLVLSSSPPDANLNPTAAAAEARRLAGLNTAPASLFALSNRSTETPAASISAGGATPPTSTSTPMASVGMEPCAAPSSGTQAAPTTSTPSAQTSAAPCTTAAANIQRLHMHPVMAAAYNAALQALQTTPGTPNAQPMLWATPLPIQMPPAMFTPIATTVPQFIAFNPTGGMFNQANTAFSTRVQGQPRGQRAHVRDVHAALRAAVQANDINAVREIVAEVQAEQMNAIEAMYARGAGGAAAAGGANAAGGAQVQPRVYNFHMQCDLRSLVLLLLFALFGHSAMPLAQYLLVLICGTAVTFGIPHLLFRSFRQRWRQVLARPPAAAAGLRRVQPNGRNAALQNVQRDASEARAPEVAAGGDAAPRAGADGVRQRRTVQRDAAAQEIANTGERGEQNGEGAAAAEEPRRAGFLQSIRMALELFVLSLFPEYNGDAVNAPAQHAAAG
jgi:hypothetical protein